MKLEYLSGPDNHALDEVMTFVANNNGKIMAIGLNPINTLEILLMLKNAWNTPQRAEVFTKAKIMLATLRRRGIEHMYGLPDGLNNGKQEYDDTYEDIINMALNTNY